MDLWNKAEERLRAVYGEEPPLPAVNRLESEKTELWGTEWPVCFDFLGTLSDAAKAAGRRGRLRDGMGAFFTAWLLGASEINPLPAHYRCPRCGAAEFVPGAADGWDLPPKTCRCGAAMLRDGHAISCEPYRRAVRGDVTCGFSIGTDFGAEAEAEAVRYFGARGWVCSRDREAGAKTLVLTAAPSKTADARPAAFLRLDFYLSEEMDRCRALEAKTGVPFDAADCLAPEVLRAFARGDTEGIPEFDRAFVRYLLRKMQPERFSELVRILGVAHDYGSWLEAGRLLTRDGTVSADQLITSRDDVFDRVAAGLRKNGLAETGFACAVAEAARKGRYARRGMDAATRNALLALGLEPAYIDSLCRVQYLFPKAYEVLYAKYAMALMWYRLRAGGE